MVPQFRLTPGNIPINCQKTDNPVREFEPIGNYGNSVAQNLGDN